MNAFSSLLLRRLSAALVFGLLACCSPKSPAIERVPLTAAEITQLVEDGESGWRGIISDLERSVTAGDDTVFTRHLNCEWLLDRATATGQGTAAAEMRTAFREGTLESWRTRSLAADYLGNHFRFLRVHTLGGRAGLLFRASGEKGALNFCLLTMAQGAEGQIAFDDIYVVGLAEFVSDTLRRGFVTLLDSMQPDNDQGRHAAAYIAALPQVMELGAALRERDHARALEIARKLPAEAREDRGVMLMRLEAAENSSLEERQAVMADWRRHFPGDMSLPLKSADLYIAEGRLIEAERVLRALDEQLGGDSDLKLRVGEVRMLQRHADRLAASEHLPQEKAPIAAQPAVQ